MTDHAGAEMTHVRQEHDHGCGIAVLAMLTDQTYQQVYDDLLATYPGEKTRVTEQGLYHTAMEWYLAQRGYAWRTVYSGWKPTSWPPEPFAPRHFAQVVQPSGNHHFVVMTEAGTVLDPLSGILTGLGAWGQVDSVYGVWNVDGADHSCSDQSRSPEPAERGPVGPAAVEES
jgi:hypothetical protein